MKLVEFHADLIPQLHNTELHADRKILISSLSGNLSTSFKGRGVEFDEYRLYTPHDDASRIDWRASLRAGKTLVREYEVERTFNVIFLIDTSNSMLLSSTGKLKCEYAAEIVSSISFAALQLGSAVGYSLFSENLKKSSPPQIGQGQFHLFMKELTNPENYGGGCDLGTALKYLIGLITERCLLVVVSDFIGSSPGWMRYLEIFSQRNEVIGIMIRDPIDRDLPKFNGQLLIEDPFSEQKIYIDAKQYMSLYAEQTRKDEKIIKNKFQLLGSDFVLFKTDEPYNQKLIRFFKRRGVRWK